MKRIIKYNLCAFLCLLIFSCGDDFLKIKPLSIYTPESIYTDEAGFEGVLVTLRKNLRVDFYAEAGGLASELISSDIAISANKAQDAIHNFDTQVLPTGTGNNYNFHEIWTRGYNQIRNANVILSRIEQGNFDSEEKRMPLLRKRIFTVRSGTID